MAPQPLSKLKTDARVSFTPLALRHQPELAALVAEAIGTWATVDAALGKLLGDMLGTAARPANAMFEALSSSTAQHSAIRGAAREALKGRTRETECFEVVMSLVKTGLKKRNPLAHHLWGASPDVEDALLLMNPRDDISADIETAERMRGTVAELVKKKKAKAGQVLPNYALPDYPADRIMVYRDRDLREIIAEFRDIADIISDFSLFAAADYRDFRSPTLAGLFDRLEAQPLVAPRLRQLRERPKNNREGHQQSPDEAAGE